MALSPQQEREQISLAVTRGAGLKKGDKWYLVSMRWWNEWVDFVDYEEKNIMPAGSRPRPGPVDNSPLKAGDTLKIALVEDQDFVLLPRTAWRLLLTWYGGGPKISRRVFSFGEGPRSQLSIALYPAPIDILTCGSDGNPDALTRVLEFPVRISVQELKDTLAAICYSAPHRIRLWVLRDANWFLMGGLDRTLEDYGLQGHLTAAENKVMIESKTSQDDWPRDSPLSAPREMEVVNTNASSSEMSYWSRPDGSPGTPPASGMVGLQNLGNTCFMNSALQCLSHTPALSTFFLQKEYKEDINLDNPLGMKGALAEEYYEMLKLIWGGQFRSVAPGRFKSSLGKFAPQFSGYQQQDSQELLAFLLDGLHEDLNRVKKKPYVPAVESNGRSDEVVAKEAWVAHLERNKSVIVDLFQGQLKSTVTCPDCSKVSITFDPFMYLSVPLPVRLDRVIPISFVHINKPRRTKLAIRIAKSGRVAELRGAIAAMVNLPAEQVLVAEVYRSRIFDAFSDDRELTRISERDEVFAYELLPMPPTPAPVPVATAVDAAAKVTTDATTGVLSSNSGPADPPPPPSREPSLEAIATTPASAVPLPTDAPVAGTTADAAAGQRSATDIEIKDVQAQAPPAIAAPTTSTSTALVVVPQPPMPIIIRVYQNDAEPKAIAYPLMLSYTETPTGARVHADIVSNIFTRFATQERLPSPSPLVFRCFRNGYSGQCARCTVEACKGCVLTSDDETPFKLVDRLDAVVVDWVAAAAPALDETKTTGQDVHESAAAYEAEQRRPIALSECFELFTKAERLAPEDMWYCSNCKDHRQAFKKLELWSLPAYLVIHLKRFQFSRSLRDKIPSLVQFPLQDLNVTPFAGGANAPAAQSVPYDLYAVSNHSGDLGGGHYTAAVFAHDQWWDCNDSSVGQLDATHVVREEAYLLFYKRRDAPSRVICPDPPPAASAETVAAASTLPVVASEEKIEEPKADKMDVSTEEKKAEDRMVIDSAPATV